MMRSLYSGITGLRNHQTRMDVIGNNIANVNTIGFKSSRVVFSDIYSQTLQSASGGIQGADGTLVGGTNPRQIGLGVTVANIQTLHSPAPPQYTGYYLDMMIDGDGYFVLKNGTSITYTRAGAFDLDQMNNICAPDGSLVQGFLYELEVDADGKIIGNVIDTSYDPDTATNPKPTVTADGALTWAKTDTDLKDRLENIVLDDRFYNVKIDKQGNVTALTKDGDVFVYLGVVAIATFPNNGGLEKIGGSQYRSTVNSGAAAYTTAGVEGAGSLAPNSLEMSNVDLASEFTDMIVTQRGFQANSRTITVSDTMLEELVNLKR